MKKKSLHILHLIPNLNLGGAEKFVCDLSNQLLSEKVQVSLIIFYDLDKKIEFNYNLLNPDQELNHKLQRLPSKKFVFTNGTLWHANNCLDKLSIKSNFERIVARDTINCYKPHIVSYLKFMLLSSTNLPFE